LYARLAANALLWHQTCEGEPEIFYEVILSDKLARHARIHDKEALGSKLEA
jgi:hypothetical protein